MLLKQRVWLTKENTQNIAIQVVGPKRDDVGNVFVVELKLPMVENRLD